MEKNKKVSNIKYIIIVSLTFVLITLYLYNYSLLINILEKCICILFFFFFIIYYLDSFKLHESKIIRYLQIIIFVAFIVYIFIFIYLYVTLYSDIIFNLNPDEIKKVYENTDIVLKGKVVLDKESGAEVAKGLSNLGSNVGLGACIGALAGGVTKAVAKSGIPPIQKAGLIVASGVIGAALHIGANGVNTKIQANRNVNVSQSNINKNILPKDINKFIDYKDDNSPMEILLLSINILNWVAIWVFIVITLQFIFKYYVTDKPELKIIDYILPFKGKKVKEYIYKIIKLNKSISLFYTIFGWILLFISLIGSWYFSLDLFTSVQEYVDLYNQYKN